MTRDPFIDRLSDYIDRELPSDERRRLDEHLRTCPDCRALLDDLRTLRRDARALPRHQPAEHVWESLASRIRAASQTRAKRRRAYALLAAAAVLLLGVGLWASLTVDLPPPGSERVTAEQVGQDLERAEAHYKAAIAGLEDIIARNDGVLPPEVRTTLTDNLDLIESTIDESRAAIATEPDSQIAQESLLDAFRRKVSLLQNMILLINEVRKGEGENALELIDEIRRTEQPNDPM